MFKLILLFISFGVIFPIQAQEMQAPSPIIFIYDASGSMWGQMDGKTKMEIAADVLSDAVNALPDHQKIGFVAYGHRKKGDCEDVEFLVDVENGSKSAVTSSIQNIKPLGKTPLAYSALQVIEKLRQTKLKATIILVTDGIESCGGNLCDVIKQAKAEGIDFKLHIIGFGLKDSETAALKCAAQAGNGNYYDANDAGGLGDVLDEATAQTIDEMEGNLSVYAMKNGIAIDALIKAYDVISKREPIAIRTYKDTAFFYLPPSTYNFEVVPLEGTDVDMITVDGITSFDDRIVHQTISFDGGKLGITTTNNGENWDCVVKLIDINGTETASSRMYSEPKEIEVNPGIYRVTIQALSLKGIHTYSEIENVAIRAGDITPLSHEFTSGSFQIYTMVGSENIDAVVKIKELNSSTEVGRSRTYDRGSKFLLNTGEYEVHVKPLSVHKDKTSQTITIEVEQGEVTTKTLKF